MEKGSVEATIPSAPKIQYQGGKRSDIRREPQRLGDIAMTGRCLAQDLLDCNVSVRRQSDAGNGHEGAANDGSIMCGEH